MAANQGRAVNNRQLDLLDRLAREWTAEFPLPVEEVPPLFHYTNAAGLVGIVEDQSLWATAIGHSNDLREIRCAYDIARPEMQELAASAQFDHPSQRSLMRSLQGFFTDSDHPLQDGYSVSFCAQDDLLSQWRAYGEQGGFSIELHPLTQLNAILRAPVSVFRSDTGEGSRVLLRAVDYDPDNQRRAFRTRSERVLALLRRLAGEDNSPELTAAVLAFTAYWVVEWIYSVKDPAFREEQEWRLICLPETRWTRAGEPVYAHPESVRSRVRNSGILPYVRLRLANGLLPIRAVTCGPAQHPGLNKKAVGLLLKSKGYASEVRNSRVPLRTYR